MEACLWNGSNGHFPLPSSSGSINVKFPSTYDCNKKRTVLNNDLIWQVLKMIRMKKRTKNNITAALNFLPFSYKLDRKHWFHTHTSSHPSFHGVFWYSSCTLSEKVNLNRFFFFIQQVINVAICQHASKTTNLCIFSFSSTVSHLLWRSFPFNLKGQTHRSLLGLFFPLNKMLFFFSNGRKSLPHHRDKVFFLFFYPSCSVAWNCKYVKLNKGPDKDVCLNWSFLTQDS